MGLLDMLGGLGTTPPSYMEGLLGAQATEDLRKRSIGSGLVNALIGYAAAPKNQNLGLGRILASAAQSGLQGARGVYDTATQDVLTQQRLAEMQRNQQQEVASREAIDQLLKDPKVANDPVASAFIRANPTEALKLYAAPRERKTVTVDNQVIDVSGDEAKVLFTGQKELKALPTYEIQQGRNKITMQIQPDGTEKEIARGSMDAPRERTPKALYASTPTDTPSGFVYMPTPEGLQAGYRPISASSGKPVDMVLSKTAEADKAAKEKQATRTESQIAQANKVIAKVDSALENVSFFTTGTGKAFTPKILESATGAADLESELETIKANLGFAELQAMRESSPTGGALGQVAVQELVALQSTVASLADAQTPEQLIKNLNEIKTHYENWKGTLSGKMPRDSEKQKAADAKPASPLPRIGDKKNGYTFMGGNPNDPKSWKKD